MREALEKAHRAAAATGSARYLALCDRMIGDLLLEHGELPEARQRYQAASAHFTNAGGVADAAACVLALGRIEARQGKLDRAASKMQTVLRIAEGALPELDWQAYRGLGRIAGRRGDKREALRWVATAVEALRRGRLTLPEARLAGGFAASHRAVYDAGVRLALDLEDNARALEIAEESRARVLTRTLDARPRLETKDPYVRQLLDQELDLRLAVQGLRRQLLGSLEKPAAKPSHSSGASPALLRQLRGCRSAHRQVLQRLYAATDEWLDAVDPFSWPRFCRTARERMPTGWSALIYHWLGQRLAIFYTDGHDLRVWVRESNPVERAALDMGTSVDPGRRALMFRGDLCGRSLPSDIGSRYRKLLCGLLFPREVLERLSPDRPLLIVPHGRLHHLPFQALENERGFLAEQAIICRPSRHRRKPIAH
jgi:tetratricopeptide (TPR) repeat protein